MTGKRWPAAVIAALFAWHPLRVESVAWKDADGAKASGGYFEGGESASGNTYTLARHAGAWRVVKDVMNWIS